MKKKSRFIKTLFIIATIMVSVSGIIAFANMNMQTSTETKINEPSINLYYGVKSYDALTRLAETKKLLKVNTMAFHWGEIGINTKDNQLMLKNKMPLDFEKPLKIAKKQKLETYFSVYMVDGYDQLFQGDVKPETWFMTQLEEKISSKATFDGIVIDMEALPKQYQENYLVFLEALKPLCDAQNIKVWVAVQPNVTSDFNRLIASVDQCILMLHDYEAKKLMIPRTGGKVITPLAPIDKVERDLSAIVSQIKNSKDLSKLSLQVNMATAQWKVKDGALLNLDQQKTFAYPYRPEYYKVLATWESMIKNKKVFELGYLEREQLPYLYFKDEAEGTYNTILFENEKSIRAKMNLAKKYGVCNFSVWRVGNIPESSKLDMDILSEVLKK